MLSYSVTETFTRKPEETAVVPEYQCIMMRRLFSLLLGTSTTFVNPAMAVYLVERGLIQLRSTVSTSHFSKSP